MRAWGSWDDADLWGEAWDSRPDTWDEELDAAAGRPPRGQSGPGQWVGNLHGGWNMSAAARAYQEQITGVSAAYDYRVTLENRHADFDGYDWRQGKLRLAVGKMRGSSHLSESHIPASSRMTSSPVPGVEAGAGAPMPKPPAAPLRGSAA